MTTMLGNLMFREREMYKEKFGEERYKSFIDSMDEEFRNFYNGIIISAERYDLKYHIAFQEALSKEIGIEEADKFNEELAKQQLRGLFGFITKFISLDVVLKQSQKMWEKVYNEGRLTWEKEEGTLKINIDDFYFKDTHLEMTLAYFKGMLEKIENKKVKAESKRVNEKSTEFIFRYK